MWVEGVDRIGDGAGVHVAMARNGVRSSILNSVPPAGMGDRSLQRTPIFGHRRQRAFSEPEGSGRFDPEVPRMPGARLSVPSAAQAVA